MKDKKNFKILGVRQSLIGDCLMGLPVLNFLEKRFPDSYKYWHISKKCAQAGALFYNHPLIDKIIITDCEEGFGRRDIELAKYCDLVINTTPQHPLEHDWHNYRSMVEETWIMAGIPLNEYHYLSDDEKTPTLTKWFDINKQKNTIAIHCFAGYGRDNHRSPNLVWWKSLIPILQKSGFEILRLGHPAEPYLENVKDLRNLCFFDQVKLALESDTYIGTDSGFSLVMGAYKHPQITLLTNWNVNHNRNFNCLEPVNKNNITLFNAFNQGGCSGIKEDEVLNALNNLI